MWAPAPSSLGCEAEEASDHSMIAPLFLSGLVACVPYAGLSSAA